MAQVTGAQEDSNMVRKSVVAAVLAAMVGLGVAGLPAPASAEWGGPRYGDDRHRRMTDEDPQELSAGVARRAEHRDLHHRPTVDLPRRTPP